MVRRARRLGIAGLVFAASCNFLGDIQEGRRVKTSTCDTVDDCHVENPECSRVLECVEGLCRHEDQPSGRVLMDQVVGDCAEFVCDGEGGIKKIPNPADIVADDNPCTVDSCGADGQPSHVPHPGQFIDVCYTGPPGTSDKGICQAGTQACKDGEAINGCEGEVLPNPGGEVCGNNIDDDCDGEKDEGCSCVTTIPCYTGDPGTLGAGNCKAGAQCVSFDGQIEGTCDGEVTPQPELCDPDGKDEDCDGRINEEGPSTSCTCGDTYLSNAEQCDPPGGACRSNCTRVVNRVSAGGNHTCALLWSGGVKCWGKNNWGQLGLGKTDNRGDEANEMGADLPPVDLGQTGGDPLKAINVSAGGEHTCALLQGGGLKCWGNNAYGQLGLGNTLNQGDGPNEMGNSLPFVDLGTLSINSLSTGRQHTCAIVDDGDVKCWGRNDLGQLGLGDTENRGHLLGTMGEELPKVDLGTGVKVEALAAGNAHTCALLKGGGVKCWGDNGHGQLGIGDTSNRGDAPGEMGNALPLVNLGDSGLATAIAAGGDHSCALLTNGSVKCWGANGVGELGLGYAVDVTAPASDVELGLPPGVGVMSIVAGAFHLCALVENGSIKCWGYNGSGRLGLGDTLDRGAFPEHMGTSLPYVDLNGPASVLAAGSSHTCALRYDSSLRCWGINVAGQLGLGDKASRGDQESEMGDKMPEVLPWSADDL